ncbi:hypothetical protein [Mycobacterium sp. NPDC050853]|uniref:hypothetical protein n=1 Tax=Mycobacterium sp. NPDC050853 TaxID=3155160 RepID=UPI0033C02B99
MTDQIRKWFYLLSAVLASVVPILVTLKVITDNQGNQWVNLLATVAGVLGVAAPTTAGVILHKQIKGAAGEPIDKVVTSLQDVQAQLDSTTQAARDQLATATQAVADTVNRIQQTIGGPAAVASIALGPLAAQVIEAAVKQAGPRG